MTQAPIVYQETHLSPTPPPPSQILHINTSSDQQQNLTFGAGRKRGFEEISGLDEESYARKHLATEGSVFFRRKTSGPRSFLWRVLEDRKVLEVQSVDLVRDKSAEDSESWLTFRITLPNEIVRNGVALADPEESDALVIFVLTSGHELYTFTLKRDLLTRKVVPRDFDAKTCFKKYSSNSLAFRHPYRMVATSSLELLLSLHDGGLICLARRADEGGAQWRETFFSEGRWTETLRGLIPLKRHQTVKYGDLELEPSAIAAMAKSPDGNIIWTVSLDYQLKAWSTETGKPMLGLDVSNFQTARDGGQQPSCLMDGDQGTLLQVVIPNTRQVAARTGTNKIEDYYMVLHSPKSHEFKFFAVVPVGGPNEGKTMKLRDLAIDLTLIPPIDELMNTNIWHLEQFYVCPGVNGEDTQLWLRARSGSLCKIFNLTFDLLGEDDPPADLATSWQCGWTVVDTGMQTADALRASLDYPGDLDSVVEGFATPSERWVDFLFQPGRFTTASIESALHVYRKGRGLPRITGGKGLNAPQTPLKERVTQAVASKIMLRRLANELPDYDRYQADIQAQWKTFSSLLLHLHTRRHESIGFAFDPADELPWTISAGFVAPIRTCSKFDLSYLNKHLLAEGRFESLESSVVDRIFPRDDDVNNSAVLNLAQGFNSRLSTAFRDNLKRIVIDKALVHEAGDQEKNEKCVQALYDGNRFTEEVMDNDFEALESMAVRLNGLGSLTEDAFRGVIEVMGAGEEPKRRGENLLNRYGGKLVIAVAQETLERDQATLLDILTLVVFMYGDLDQSDLHTQFVSDIGQLYDSIIVRIKHNELRLWMARTEMPELSWERRSSKPSEAQDDVVPTVTVLERIAIGDWDPRSRGGRSVPALLTLWTKQWAYAADLYANWDGITGHILAVLMKERLYDLAAEFQKFLTPGQSAPSWNEYLQGRLLLATGDYALASMKFREAATDMAQAAHIGTVDTAYLLSDEDQNYFGHGHSAFYQHVATLFEKLRVFSYTADFARLALYHLESDSDLTLEELDKRKGILDSPALHRMDDAMAEISHLRKVEETRDDIRSRLFTALVQTGRFREAFDALVGIGELPMKKASLQELIEKCMKQDAVHEMLSLPFEQAKLAQEADAVLSGLAKKGLTSGSAENLQYYQVLYAFRTQRADFRGAAEVLHEHLERLRYTTRKHGMQDSEDETLIHAYVLLINTLACCGDEDAWLLADPIDELHGTGKKRRLVRIADVRRDYNAELDKRSDILQGRFPVVGGDEMDVL